MRSGDPHTTSDAARVAFSRAYQRRMPEDEEPAISADQFDAEISCAFGFLNARGREPFAVRVFRPDVGSCGYEAPGSVVEIVTDDASFLVDSISNRLTRLGYTIVRHFHPVVGTTRDSSGDLIEVIPGKNAPYRESLQHYELAESLPDEEARELETQLGAAIGNIRATVRDYEPMRFAVRRMAHYAFEDGSAFDSDEVDEAIAFLDWLLDDNFILLGYREYDIVDDGEGPAIVAKTDSGLGILSEGSHSRFAEPVLLGALPPDLRSRYETGRQLVISKTNRRSTVHRDSRMDYVGLRRVHPDGTPKGEARLVGLFTSKAYMAQSATMPILRRKLQRILAEEDLVEGSHDYKVITQIFESFPKDELFSITREDLRKSLVGLLEAEEHQHVRLFVRSDVLHRNVSILVVVPRDRFDANLRRQLQDLILERYGGVSIDYQLTLGETGDARIHFTVWMEGSIPTVPFEGLEKDVYRLTRTWDDRVCQTLAETQDQGAARALIETYAYRYPAHFRAASSLGEAARSISDVDALMSGSEPIRVSIFNESDSDEHLTRIIVYSRGGKRDLSEMLPLIEDLGLRVIEEIPTRLSTDDDDDELFAHDFGVLGPDGGCLDVDACGPRVSAALTATLIGEGESDGLSRLLVLTDLDHRQINVLRAYRSYWHLVNPAFSKSYVAQALATHPGIADDLVGLFETRFGPAADEGVESDLRATLLEHLEAVASLDEDRILRAFLGLIDATVRTSAFLETGSLAFKFLSSKVPAAPEPRPMYEIFVFAPEVAGVHLRGGPVARGGIRWSIRRQDYRTEVLGLMKAQMTKNVVIVPTGAKGGFVMRRVANPAAGPTFDEVRAGYRVFINALLDVTDNYEEGRVVHPAGVRTLDGEDPYFVVAADRGTATFSDIANEIAVDAGFWLDDAFASGGSTGYDHKALGITARGAWESVRRHFMELDVDVESDPVTVVGVGDMSGDVFGNGMLLSRSIRLVAAFDHRHIFIDPNPDAERSFNERERVAGLGRSSWDDYDRDAISPGGGIFPRTLKRIELTEEMRSSLGTTNAEMTPHELISTILKAPVDLLWNGGIGTYVKAKTETHDDAQDRSNDAVRVNGRDLRCRVVGEGGNLGFTQAGRIEYDRSGGRIFTDSIDNSGGVHCSDREVNIKILLRIAERSGDLTRDARNQLIETVSEDVVAAIVYDNFVQAQILSQEAASSADRMESYEDLMVLLEAEAGLDREIEVLPLTETMAERARTGWGMARPELAVLLAYAKRHLTDELVDSDLPESVFVESLLTDYFPREIVDRFEFLILTHPLRRQLVSTIVANEMLNSQGVTFVSRLEAETGAGAAEIVRAYRTARGVVGASARWHDVEALAGSIDADVLRQLLSGIDDLVETVTRWFIVRRGTEPILDRIDAYQPGFVEIARGIQTMGPKQWQNRLERRVKRFVDFGVPERIAFEHVSQVELVHAPDIIDVAADTGLPLHDVGRAFYRVGQAFHIDWLEREIESLPASTRWQRWATLSLEQELMNLRRAIVERVLADRHDGDIKAAFAAFSETTVTERERLARLVSLLRKDGVSDSAAVVVALRQMMTLAGRRSP
ncbi:MAG: NAD-glutamate dehydrogenase [Actinomycetia bacterium]|nr:NAD-glutamate dehydrogenase [Actinomycetes bacterium]